MNKLTTTQLAKHYNITILTVYNWMKRGCPSVKALKGLKSVYLFDLQEVSNWLDREGK